MTEETIDLLEENDPGASADPMPPAPEENVTPRTGTDYVVLSLEQDNHAGSNLGSTWRVQVESITAASADQAIRLFSDVGPQPGTFIAVPVRSFQRRTVVAETVVTTRFASGE